MKQNILQVGEKTIFRHHFVKSNTVRIKFHTLVVVAHLYEKATALTWKTAAQRFCLRKRLRAMSRIRKKCVVCVCGACPLCWTDITIKNVSLQHRHCDFYSTLAITLNSQRAFSLGYACACAMGVDDPSTCSGWLLRCVCPCHVRHSEPLDYNGQILECALCTAAMLVKFVKRCHASSFLWRAAPMQEKRRKPRNLGSSCIKLGRFGQNVIV